jgi:hypothetical protein
VRKIREREAAAAHIGREKRRVMSCCDLMRELLQFQSIRFNAPFSGLFTRLIYRKDSFEFATSSTDGRIGADSDEPLFHRHRQIHRASATELRYHTGSAAQRRTGLD